MEKPSQSKFMLSRYVCLKIKALLVDFSASSYLTSFKIFWHNIYSSNGIRVADSEISRCSRSNLIINVMITRRFLIKAQKGLKYTKVHFPKFLF